MQNRLRTGTTSAIIANGLVFAVLVYATLLYDYDFDLYYLGIQEDAYLEWATFWAFLIAVQRSRTEMIAGHDAAVMSMFPAPTKELEGMAVSLHESPLL